MITFPLWFKILLASGIIPIIWGTYLCFTKDKYIAKIKELPDGKKEKLIKANSRVVKILKLFFWATPVNLILTPYLIYTYNSEAFFHYFTVIIIAHIIAIESFLIDKALLKNLNKINK